MINILLAFGIFSWKITAHSEVHAFPIASNCSIKNLIPIPNKDIQTCIKRCRLSGLLYANIKINWECHCTSSLQAYNKCSCPDCITKIFHTKPPVFEILSSVIQRGENISVSLAGNGYHLQDFKSIDFTVEKIKLPHVSEQTENARLRFDVETARYSVPFELCMNAKDDVYPEIIKCWNIQVQNYPIVTYRVENVTELENGSIALKSNSCIIIKFYFHGNFSFVSLNIGNILVKKFQINTSVPMNKTATMCDSIVARCHFKKAAILSLQVTAYGLDPNYKHVLKKTDFLIVQDEISFVCLKSTHGFLGAESVFKAKLYGPTTGVLFQWYFKEENKTIKTDVPECRYNVTYSETFVFPVQLTASNLVSRNSTKFDVLLVPYITDVILEPKRNPVLEGDPVSINSTILTPKASWIPKFDLLWIFEVGNHVNTHLNSFRDFRVPSPGTMRVTLSVISDLLTVNGSCLMYVIKKIIPFPLYYEKFKFHEPTVFKGDINVVDYEASAHTPKYNLVVNWWFGDAESTTNGDVIISHTYDSPGIYIAHVNVSNILSYYVSSVKVYVQSDVCDIQIYFPLDWDSIKIIKLSDTLKLYPAIKAECTNATELKYKWKFGQLLLSHLQLKSRSLNIPATSIGIGKWKFSFQVTLNYNNVTREYNNTLLVIPSGLKAVIKGTGIRVIDRSLAEEIVLDFSESVDLDSPAETGKLKYYWRCYTKKHSSCFQPNNIPKLMPNESRVAFLPKHLHLKATKFLFVHYISKGDVKSENTTLLLKINKKIKYQVFIVCDTCSTNKYSSFAKIKFTAHCPSCEDNNVKYKWKVKHREVKSPLVEFFTSCIPNLWPVEHLTMDGNNTVSEVPRVEKSSENSASLRCELDVPKDLDQTCFRHNLYCEKCTNTNCTLDPIEPLKNLTVDVKQPTDSPIWFQNNLKKHMSWTRMRRSAIDDAGKKTPKEFELNEISYLKHYFEDRGNYYDRKTYPNDYTYGDEKKTLLIQANSLFPGQPYQLSVTVYTNDKRKVELAKSLLFFKTDLPPVKGRCRLTGKKIGIKLHTLFTITCDRWKSNSTLTYTLSTREDEKVETVLHTKVFKFDFILVQTGEVQLLVTIFDDEGKWVSLCELKVTVYNNPNLNYLESKLDLNKLDGPEHNLQQLTAILTEINSMMNVDTQLKEDICGNFTSLIFEVTERMTVMALKLLLRDTPKLSRKCINFVVSSLEKIVFGFSHSRSLYRPIKHQTYVEDLFAIINMLKMDLVIEMDNQKTFKKILQMQKHFLQLLKREYYLNETFAMRRDCISVVSGKGFHFNFSGEATEPSIKITESSCYDLNFVIFSKSLLWLDENIIEAIDVSLDSCSDTKTLFSTTSYQVKYPLNQLAGFKKKLLWANVNLHQFDLLDFTSSIHIYIEINERSLNFHHFHVIIEIRHKNTNVSTAISQLYPNDFTEEKLLLIVSPRDLEMAPYFEVSVEIISIGTLYRKVIEEPWCNYTMSVQSSYCKQWNPLQNFLPLYGCKTDMTSTKKHLVCSCNQPGFVTGYTKELLHRDYLVTSVKIFKTRLSKFAKASPGSNMNIIEMAATVIIFFFLLILLSWYLYSGISLNNIIFNLPENHPCDTHKYDMIIETGHSFNSGTTSKVCAILYGTQGHSQKFELTCDNAYMFQRSSTDVVSLRCPCHLGDLTNLQIWHNNYGCSPDWYIKQVVVKSAAKTFYFPFHNWLSLTKGFHESSCLLTATERCCTSKIQIFFEKLVDYNVWFSVFIGPTCSPFSLPKRFAYILCKLLFLGACPIVLYEDFIQKNNDLLSLFHIQSWESLTSPIFVALFYLPFSAVLGYCYRNSVKSKVVNKKSLLKKHNKVGVGEKVIGDPFSKTSVYAFDDQFSVYSTSTLATDVSSHPAVWTFNLPYAFQSIASIAIFTFVVLDMFIICWKALGGGIKLGTSYMQFVFLAIGWDIVVISPCTSALQSLLSALFLNNENYYECIFQTCTEAPQIKKNQRASYKDLSIRLRARFIRYAEPLKATELKPQCAKQIKKRILGKYIKRIILDSVMLVVAIILVSFIDIPALNRNHASISETMRLRDMVSTKDFWNWCNDVVPDLINNDQWHVVYGEQAQSQQFKVLGPALFQNDSSEITLQGKKNQIAKIVSRLRNESLEEASTLKLSFNWMNNFGGKSLCSGITVEIFRGDLGVLNQRLSIDTIFLHRPRITYVTLITALVGLTIIAAILWFGLYLKMLEKGPVAFLNFSFILNLTISSIGSLAVLTSFIQSVVSYNLLSSLNLIEFSAHQSQGHFLDMQRYIQTSKLSTLSRGLLLFFATFKFVFLFKLFRTTHRFILVLKNVWRTLLSYVAFVAIFVMMSSHVTFLLLHNHSPSYSSFSNTFSSIASHLPYLRWRDAPARGLVLPMLFSIALYLLVKTSCIVFLGQLKLLKKKKIISLKWILRKSWNYYGKNFKKFFHKRKKRSMSRKIPKKYVFKEINYQLEEMLYRVDKLAEMESILLQQKNESDCSTCFNESSSVSESGFYMKPYSHQPAALLADDVSIPVKKDLELTVPAGNQFFVIEKQRNRSVGNFRRFSLSSMKSKDVSFGSLKNNDAPLKPVFEQQPDEPRVHGKRFARFCLNDRVESVTSDARGAGLVNRGFNSEELSSPSPVLEQLGRQKFSRFNLAHLLGANTSTECSADETRKVIRAVGNTKKTLSPEESMLRLNDLEKDFYGWSNIPLQKTNDCDSGVESLNLLQTNL